MMAMSGCASRTSLRFSVQKMKKGVRFLGCGFAMDAGAWGALGPLASGAWSVLLRVPMALSRPFAPAALAPAAPSPEACMGARCALLMSSAPSRARSRCPAPPVPAVRVLKVRGHGPQGFSRGSMTCVMKQRYMVPGGLFVYQCTMKFSTENFFL